MTNALRRLAPVAARRTLAKISSMSFRPSTAGHAQPFFCGGNRGTGSQWLRGRRSYPGMGFALGVDIVREIRAAGQADAQLVLDHQIQHFQSARRRRLTGGLAVIPDHAIVALGGFERLPQFVELDRLPIQQNGSRR